MSSQFIYRFSQNYQLCLGKTLSLDEILNVFERDKENLKFQLDKRDQSLIVTFIVIMTLNSFGKILMVFKSDCYVHYAQ